MSASNNQRNTDLVFVFLSILFIMGIVHLGFVVRQTEFQSILISFSILFGIYMVYLRYFRFTHFSILLGVAILVRVILVFSTPALSDDVYRFLWDGLLSLQGINPLASTPSAIISDSETVSISLRELYPYLNSADYYSVYPPLAQLTFLIAVTFAKSISLQIIGIKIILLGFEVATLLMFRRMLLLVKLPREHLLLYALNPLVIIEIMANTHYEGVLLFFLIWSIWLSSKSIRWAGSGFAMASSIASKLTSLMYLPLWLKYKGFSWSLKFYLIITLCVFIYWSPFINYAHLENFGESLNLYFQTFEFNASLYYIVRWIGFQFKGYNMIADLGPMLTIIPIVVILYLSYRQQKEQTSQLLLHILIYISVYLFCATTVHPWYIIIPIGISIFTRFRYAIFWSYLATWSYSHYQNGIIEPRYAWLLAEYLLLGLYIIIETRRSRIPKGM